MKKSIAILFVLLLIAGAAYARMTVVGIAGMVAAPAGGLLFYSDFEDASDRAQWDTIHANWNSAYTDTVLFGSASLFADGAPGRTAVASFTGDTTNTIYARAAIRVVKDGSSGGSAVLMTLLSDGGRAGQLDLIWTSSVNDFYRCYVYAGDNYDFSDPTTDLKTTTWWLYLTYNRGVSVVGAIKDAAHEEHWSDTRTTTDNLEIDGIDIRAILSDSDVVVDNVEVRTDTDWGQP